MNLDRKELTGRVVSCHVALPGTLNVDCWLGRLVVILWALAAAWKLAFMLASACVSPNRTPHSHGVVLHIAECHQ